MKPTESSGRSVLVAGLLLPPLGLVRVWTRTRLRWLFKLLASLLLMIWTLAYFGLVIALLIFLTPLDIEWQGGFPPVLTLSKTVPDYDAVEAHRSRIEVPDVADVPSSVEGYTNSYWVGFRGPDRDGHYQEQSILTDWPVDGLSPVWRQPIGGGYASFAIAEGRVYTIEQRRDQEAVTAYDLRTGREIWTVLYPALFNESMGGEGPRTTPTYHDGRLYALGATGVFHCLEAATGRVLWHKNILEENQAENLHWAQSASPLVIDDKVIVAPGGPDGKSVVAYHRVTGDRVWSVLDEPAAYSSPVIMTLAGQRQLLVVVLNRVVGLGVEDGHVLWEFPWVVKQNNRNIAQPILVGTNRFVLSAGYGTGCAAVEITRTGDAFAARELWRNRNLKNKFTSSVFSQGYIYGLDEDRLTCIDPETGARQWKDGRYGYGQLLLASDHLVILCGDGDLALVKTSPAAHEEIARFSAIPGKTWNHPALAGGQLLVRNSLEMACYDLRIPVQ